MSKNTVLEDAISMISKVNRAIMGMVEKEYRQRVVLKGYGISLKFEGGVVVHVMPYGASKLGYGRYISAGEIRIRGRYEREKNSRYLKVEEVNRKLIIKSDSSADRCFKKVSKKIEEVAEIMKLTIKEELSGQTYREKFMAGLKRKYGASGVTQILDGCRYMLTFAKSKLGAPIYVDIEINDEGKWCATEVRCNEISGTADSTIRKLKRLSLIPNGRK